ncbi:cytidine deaminase [Sphingomonas sp. Leaf407]|uniref:cytidine deaminase n=1 Tax=unclassified Sphingomonas TaxID=196159 RepID=UPI0006F8CDE1|nr:MULTISPECIES: cytidine deaminase [unclassified Sphingomonas]KQN37754.1 cytidine deaminase [Sphingomonas sp. Leaf42]KQT28121.1 cytidine deaminase [Sphingomonas sp. Leaf407]
MTDPDRLIAAAREAAAHAHAPYSKFAVGAALLLADGSIVTGANFENASYGLSLCAETVATATASASGRLREIVAVGIVGGRIGHADTDPILPCGRCRQVLNEAAQMGPLGNLDIYCSGLTGGKTETYRLSDLLPNAFGPANLKIGGHA